MTLEPRCIIRIDELSGDIYLFSSLLFSVCYIFKSRKCNVHIASVFIFCIEDSTGPELLKIRLTPTGLSLWFCLHKCFQLPESPHPPQWQGKLFRWSNRVHTHQSQGGRDSLRWFYFPLSPHQQNQTVPHQSPAHRDRVRGLHPGEAQVVLMTYGLIQLLVLALRSSSLTSRCYRCAKPKNCCSSSAPGVQRNNRLGVWAQLQVSPFRWSTRFWWHVVERGAQGVVGTRLLGAVHLRDLGLWAYPWASPGIHQQGQRRQNRIGRLVSTEVAENTEPPTSASTSTLRGWSSTPPVFRKAWSADLVQAHSQ